MEQLVGQTIKDYEIRKYITHGGFGAVYRAHQISVQRDVAMKVILPERANQPDFIRRFEAEAQIVARLESPYIVPLYSYWREPTGAYLVMRWLGGGSLYDRLQNQGALSIEEAVEIMNNVTKALHMAHRNQVIHRDIKPGNILLDEDDYAYLTDFGIAKDHARPEALTDDGMTMGTFDYLAPEQAQSDPVTPSTDVYSLGIVLYEMLVGHHPFHKISPIEMLYKNLSEPLPDITVLDDSIRDGVNAVIQKATDKNPERRFQDVMTFAQALRQAAQLDATPILTSPIELLTPREQDVLKHMLEGKTNRQIADSLVLELATIKGYNTNIYRKLGVRSKGQAIAKARQLEWFAGKRPQSVSTDIDLLPEPINPYKGLEQFHAGDAHNFFGRNRLTEKLLKRMQDDVSYYRFLAVVGPSGSGKSSLVRAGLTPALWRGDLPNSDDWYVTDMLPSSHPLDKLEVALIKIADNKTLNLREHLTRDERGLLRVADMILPDDDESELLIIIDQFEEVFTLVEKEDDRQHFLALLYTAMTDNRSRVRVVVTLRADYYDRPLMYPDFGDMMRQRVETVLPLNAEELEQAIAEPAKQQAMKFEAGLVSRIVADVNYQPGALPLLQYALTELFERRDKRMLTTAAYEDIGGTGGALAKRADDIFLEYNDGGQEMARQLFLRLVTLGEGAEDTRRRVLRSELLAITENKTDTQKHVPTHNDSVGMAFLPSEMHTEMMDDIIDDFAHSRLLSLDYDATTREPTVEVAHEAILREWDRLRQWLNESRDDIRQQRIVAQSANDWEKHGGEKSYLLRGARLEQAENWYHASELNLTPLENQYIAASIHQREVENKEASTQKRVRRSLVAAVFVVLVLGLLVSTGFGIFALMQRNTALREAEVNHRLVLASEAEQLYANGETDLSLMLAIEALDIDEPLAEVERVFTEIATGPGLQAIIPAHNSSIRAIVFHPQLPNLAVSAGCAEIDSDNVCTQGALYLWDIEARQQVRQFIGHTNWVNAVAFSPDGVYLLSASDDGLLIVWDTETGDIVQEWREHTGAVTGVAMSANGIMAVSSSEDNTLILWNVSDGQVVTRLEGHTDGVTTVRISPDGLTALSGSQDNSIILWDINLESPTFGEILQHMEGHTSKINDVNYVPNATGALVTAVSSSQDFSIRMWNLETGEQLREFVTGNPPLFTEVTSDGVSMLISEGRAIHFWHIADWHFVQRLQNLRGAAIATLVMSADSSQILAGDSAGNLLIWTMGASNQINSYQREGGHLIIHFLPDSDLVITGSLFGGDAWLWNMDTDEILQQFASDLPLAWVELSPDGRQLLVTGQSYGSTDRSFALWDVESGEKLFDFEDEHAYWPRALAFTPDGSSVLIGTQAWGGIWDEERGSGDLILWDTTTGEMIRRFDTRIDVTGIDISADGQQALTSASRGLVEIPAVTLWDVATGQAIHTYPSSIEMYDVLFVNDETQFITAGGDGSILLWDVESGEVLQRFTAHERKVWALDISPDGQLMLSSDEGGIVILWDLQTAQVLRRFTNHTASSFVVQFSPDGDTAFSSHMDGTMIEWRIETQSLEELMTWVQDNRYVRDFTCEERTQYRIEPLCEEG